jgi:rod shape-determining protein MreD
MRWPLSHNLLVLTLHQRLRIDVATRAPCCRVGSTFDVVRLLFERLMTAARQLAFVLPALVGALLWPWVYTLLRGLHQRLNVN